MAAWAVEFQFAAPDQVCTLRAFTPSKAERADACFSFISADAAACESLRAFMNGDIQKAVHLSSLAAKLASGSKSSSASSDSVPQHMQDFSTLRQRQRTISCCFLACSMAAHSCLSDEAQYYLKTASAPTDSIRSLPGAIREHMEIGMMACVVALQRFQITTPVAAADAVTALSASQFCLSFEIANHRLLRYGTAEVVPTAFHMQLPAIMDGGNMFGVSVAALCDLVSRLSSGTSARALLEAKGRVCTPLIGFFVPACFGLCLRHTHRVLNCSILLIVCDSVKCSAGACWIACIVM